MAITRIPPFKSIEAFVVAARALSFTDAASTLNITVPAVSRRIQALETDLGTSLFQRKHRALALTPAGECYFSDLKPAIDTIRRASLNMRAAARPHRVRLHLPAALAANWLLPRLNHFHAKHRGIQVELDSKSEHSELEGAIACDKLYEEQADLVVWLGNGNWPGLRAARLLDLEGFPVCSPALLTGERLPRGLDELRDWPLLGIKGRPQLWPEWFASAGLPPPVQVEQEFDNLHLLYRAAACGLGIALGVDVLVEPYLDNGQLVRPLDSQFRLSSSYYVVCRASDLSRRPVSILRNWLLAQAAADGLAREPC